MTFLQLDHVHTRNLAYSLDTGYMVNADIIYSYFR